jgi:hypothetical protein
MLLKSTLRQHLRELVASDSDVQADARLAILRYDEDAVEPLADEFYSGVDDATGSVILNLLGEIGGPDALLVLIDVYEWGKNPAWRDVAGRALRDNGRGDVVGE